MAKIGHGRNPGYKPGNNWDTCDRCDFEFLKTDMKLEWTGLTVCDDCFETRHPQEFLRVKEEHIAADGTKSGTENTVEVTFLETTSVPSGDFNNNNGTL